MRQGDLVTLLADGLIVEAKELEPIGIFDGSQCWAIWLPNWDPQIDTRAAQIEPAIEHLLISPFHTSTWPGLFRVELRIENTPEALCKMTTVLAEQDLSILLYDLTPAGYHHVLFSAICHRVAFTRDPDLQNGRKIGSATNLKDADRWKWANQYLAPRALELSYRIRAAILTANDRCGGNFLHGAFQEPTSAFGGMLYEVAQLPANLPEEIKVTAAEQQFRAVSCRWLQAMAFYWLYGQNIDRPLKLQYDRRRCVLGPQTKRHSRRLVDRISKWVRSPVRSLALFDSYE